MNSTSSTICIGDTGTRRVGSGIGRGTSSTSSSIQIGDVGTSCDENGPGGTDSMSPSTCVGVTEDGAVGAVADSLCSADPCASGKNRKGGDPFGSPLSPAKR